MCIWCCSTCVYVLCVHKVLTHTHVRAPREGSSILGNATTTADQGDKVDKRVRKGMDKLNLLF